MSFAWFRMWTDAVDDEKLKLLAFEDRWHFVAVLCCKRKGILDAGDDATLLDRKMGAKLGLADRERDEVRRRLIEVGLIDESWQPKAWGKRQFVSDADPTAIDRKRKQREKQRHGRVTRDNRDCHGQVTGQSHSSHAPQTQITDSDTDSEKNPSLRSGGVGGKAAARPQRRAPTDFAVTSEMREWATREVPKVDLLRETSRFRDFEFRNTHSDWVATWRNWMRKAAEAIARPNGKPSFDERMAALREGT